MKNIEKWEDISEILERYISENYISKRELEEEEIEHQQEIRWAIEEERERIIGDIEKMHNKSNDGAGFGGEPAVDGYNQALRDIIKNIK
jgi:hypothetical protein